MAVSIFKHARVTELRRLLATPTAKRLGLLAAKGTVGVVAGGVGLALGLREVKRSLQLETPKDLWKEASFNVRDNSGDVSMTSIAAASAIAALPKLCARGDITEEQFWAAAARLRPVELQLLELHERFTAEPEKMSQAELRSREDALVSKWKEQGFFDPKELSKDRSNVFGRRLTSDAQGADIRVVAPPCLAAMAGVPSKGTGGMVAARSVDWSLERRRAAEEAIERWGCTLLRDLLTPEDIAQMRTAFGLGGVAGKDGKLTTPRRAGEAGLWIQQNDPNISMGRYTVGRLHLLFRGSPEFEPAAVAAHAALSPLVHTHFKEPQEAGGQVFLSEAQLIITDPFADIQFWHLDCVGGRGLTAFVPLTDVPLDKGPQELLPGSHYLHDQRLPLRERVRRCLLGLCHTHGAVLTANGSWNDAGKRVWAAGEALVLDSSTIHRGLPNDSMGAPVPILVLRYDLTDKPPPGCNRNWLLAMSRLGSSLNSFFRFYAAV